MNERLEASVAGRVQMVMYRDFAQRKARALNLVGEVENIPDGTVRIAAEGSRAALEKYLKLLRNGPLLAKVESVEAKWFPATGEHRSFEIVYG